MNSILLIIGYGLYVLLRESFRFNKTVIRGAAASLMGTIAYIPWLMKLNKIDAAGWTGQDFGALLLAGKWSANGVRRFFDVFSFDGGTPISQLLILAPAGVYFLCLIGAATYYLVNKTSRSVWLFILTLVLTTFLGLALPDLILGGRRSGVPRYAIPSLIGTQLAVAFLLERKAFSLSSAKLSKLWQVTLVGTVLSGVLSCAIISQSEVWWNKGADYSAGIVELSSMINRSTNPLVISDADVVPILSLSHQINDSTKMLLFDQIPSVDTLAGLNDFSSIYLFQSSPQLLQFVEQNLPKYTVEALYPQTAPILWVLSEKTSAHLDTDRAVEIATLE